MAGKKGERFKTIAFLVQNLEEVYHIPIWHGIKEVTDRLNFNVITYCGGVLGEDFYYEFESRRNNVYNLLNRNNTDGMIVVSSSLGVNIGKQGMESFVKKFTPLPTVSIGMDLANTPSVVVDNRVGIEAAVKHLTIEHGMKKIAYIGGPQGNFEAKIRFNAYIESLAEYGIHFNPELNVRSDFLDGAGPIAELLDKRKADFSAILTANDTMAFSAIKELQARGIKVPNDVAVIGFDDSVFAKYSYPPLTSVSQPLNVLGSQAVNMLIDLMEGRRVKQVVNLPLELVVRKSCGCFELADTHNILRILEEPDNVPAVDEINPTVVDYLCRHRDCILKDMNNVFDAATAVPPSEIARFNKDLFNAFIQEIQGSKGMFVSTFDSAIIDAEISPATMKAWRLLVSVLRQYTQKFPCRPRELSNLENIWFQISDLISDVQERGRVYDYYIGSSMMYTIRQAGYAIYNTFKMDELKDTIEKVLGKLNHKTIFIVLFDKTSGDSLSPVIVQHRVILANHNGCRIPLPENGLAFPKGTLLPEGMIPPEEKNYLYAETLAFRENLIGYQILDIGNSSESFNEWLRLQICGALQGALLLEERKMAEHNLEMANRRLKERNNELDAFAHTVAHDLKSPLTSIIGISHLLREQYLNWPVEKVKRRFQQLVERGEKLNNIIDELLMLSQVRKSEDIPFHILDFQSLLDNVIKRLSHLIESKQARLKMQQKWPNSLGYGPWVEEILANYISNAVKYGGEPPWVQIGADERNGFIRYWVKDNGKGIPVDMHSKMFAEFSNPDLLRGEGHGLGLSIVQRISDKLNGRVGYETEEGKGSLFFFELNQS